MRRAHVAYDRGWRCGLDDRDRSSFYCYLVRCADGTLYAGVATDVERRVSEHNGGRGARYTSSRRPVTLVWHEPHPDRSAAQRREAEIKRWSRARKEQLVAAVPERLPR